jgi:pilus assembly protein CpaB
MNKKSMIIVSIAVVSGLLAVFLVNRYITTKEKAINEGMEMVPVVAITQDTMAGQKITTKIIARRNVPQKYLHTNAVLAKDYELLIGQELIYPMKRGDTVLWTSLSAEAERLMTGLATAVTKGERALSIAVDEVSGVSGLIKPNNHIDILCTVRSEIDEEEATITLLQNITVLATGSAMAGDRSKKGGYRTLTLLVTLEEAELLVFAQKRGKLITILRNEEDIETKEDIPKVTFSDILKDEYLKHIQEKRNSIEVIKKGKTEKNSSN